MIMSKAVTKNDSRKNQHDMANWETEREKRRDRETKREKREDSGGIMEESKGLPCEVPTTNVIWEV